MAKFYIVGLWTLLRNCVWSGRVRVRVRIRVKVRVRVRAISN